MRLRRLSPWAPVCALIALVCCAGADAAGPAIVVAGEPPGAPKDAAVAPAQEIQLPNKANSLKFAVIGDNGNGEQRQYDVAKQMAAWRARFAYELVLMMGDNIYGSERPQDFVQKFEEPYKPLLDAGVKFYASLGNHDAREQRYYKYYNMDGKLYYSFKAPKEDVRFFALESTYPEPQQIEWFRKELEGSNEKWKICFWHHPLYSSARTHGSETRLRATLEPLLIKNNVSLVLNGHDHVYERIKPQNGIAYFVVGSSGQLREGDLRKGSPLTAKGLDTDNAFMLMEIDGDDLTFVAIDRQGKVFDSGVIKRREPPK
ncbi:MAG: metallophosphoesterase [Acidobacteria bacterium]|nr:MAG: metallophosphoesterase [Acidobacteriota bacterium]